MEKIDEVTNIPGVTESPLPQIQKHSSTQNATDGNENHSEFLEGLGERGQVLNCEIYKRKLNE